MMTLSYILTRLKGRYSARYFPRFKQVPYPSDFLAETEKANNMIYDLLSSGKPAMISRLGAFEFYTTICYMQKRHPLWMLRKIYPFWVTPDVNQAMINNTGFFNSSNKAYCQFADLMTECIKLVDILGEWSTNENVVEKYMNCKKVHLDALVPFFANKPWTQYLENKKVLVIHPFKNTILSQYQNRHKLFDNKSILPDFAQLTVYKSVQSLGGGQDATKYKSWFDALEHMQKDIDCIDYDVALIGCGAYGMPLAAHCKSRGKQAIHLGGAVQLLFGIKGKRWETEDYYRDKYPPIMNNPYWVYPNETERPQNFSNVENGCYW